MYYDAMDPFVTLTAAAAATKKLKVGTGVCLVIQRDTIQTAKLVASLDQVSGGRFPVRHRRRLEPGRDGGPRHGLCHRFKKMREQIEAMKAIWAESKPEYHGEIVDFPPMMTWPKPVQKPHPPVILGGHVPASAGARCATATAGSRICGGRNTWMVTRQTPRVRESAIPTHTHRNSERPRAPSSPIEPRDGRSSPYPRVWGVPEGPPTG
jgi:alkanesulfonate monooxygenase SsuD/methylene tetrahydromethanopterin reductase-like flavin-dependent oxidoreductase (luciferase family)